MVVVGRTVRDLTRSKLSQDRQDVLFKDTVIDVALISGVMTALAEADGAHLGDSGP